MAGLAKFNLTWSLLKGEALQLFNNKAQELKNETNMHHKLCINVVSEHIFRKNALQMQKCYLQNVHLHSLMTISEYFAGWHQLNSYLSHTTDKCKVMKEQAQQMKAMYEVQTPTECTKKHKEWKAKKAPTHDEINEMVAESVKKSVKEIFETHMKTPKKCSCEDTDSNSDSEHEHCHALGQV